MRQTASRLLLFLALFVASPAAAQIRVVFLYSDGNTATTLQAYKALIEERPDLRGQVEITFLTESVFDDVRPQDVTDANVLVLDTMNEQMLTRFNAAHKTDLLASVGSRGKVLAVGEGLLPKERYIELGATWDERARAYWAHSGFSNQLSLLKYALSLAGVKGLEIPDPEPSLDFGYYYPDGKSGRAFATWAEFDTWRREHGKSRPNAPRVAVGFYKSTYYTGEAEVLDALIASIERQGAEAIPVFGYPGAVAFDRLLRDSEGHPRADVALGAIFNFADFESSQLLTKLDIPIINVVTLYGRDQEEWRASNTGLSMFEGTFQVAVPELAGTIAPTVVGTKEKITDKETGLTIVASKPIPSRVDLAVQRALRYEALHRKANGEKHVAFVFYNYPAGKANIGASYLNVAESLANILQRLAREGYDVGGVDLSADTILSDLTAKARNVGGYAPGELDELLAEGNAVRVPISQYKEWLGRYAPELRAKILKDWGAPENGRLMTATGADGPSIVVPLVRYGNIVLLPQPARGWGENTEQLYHAKDLAPHHQYVVAYSWLRNSFKADAVVHVGTHGTLEWLDGKDMGLSEADAPDALIADLPDLYIYNVDVVGEGLVARRRGMAALIDHMVPPFKKGGLYAELAALSESLSDYSSNESKNPELARVYAEKIREQVIALGIAKDLSMDLAAPGSLDEEGMHRIEEHLLELKGQNIPYGLHAFGRVPEKALRESTIDAIISTDRSLLPNDAVILADEMERRIVASGPRELDNLVRGLRGGYLPGGNGGEPIRNPDAYPTGKNFYGIDPDKVPKPASWELGVKLADQMLADHLKRHGKYPQKVSFVIWGDETMRHEGVIESQIFHLLGTRPVWSDRGKVIGVDVISRAQLGRPRVDIVIASAAEGMFNNVTRLMDEAVQKVKALDEADNYVRDHYLETKATLISKGYSPEDADARAGVRIFDEPPGVFNLNTSGIAAASGSWDSDQGMANDYIRKLGHGYGNGFWGESMEDVFRLALSGTEKVVHSSSTTLYGALDNDDMFMYVGGLAAAIRNVDGASKGPELVVTNTRDPGKPEMTSMDKFIGTEFRSRYMNPVWIEGMKKEGYAGAGAMREFVEYLWGWEATVPEIVDDTMWNETYDVYVQDKRALGMKEFFEEQSPFAYQNMTARMIETIRKGNWKADAETEKTLLTEYLESVEQHGVDCVEYTCGNPRLSKFIMERGKITGIPAPTLQQYQAAIERATGSTLATAAAQAETFARRNDARISAQMNQARIATASVPAPPAAAPSSPQLQGYVMEARDLSQAPNAAPVSVPQGTYDRLGMTLVGGAMLGLLLAWRWRVNHRQVH